MLQSRMLYSVTDVFILLNNALFKWINSCTSDFYSNFSKCPTVLKAV